MNLRTNLASAVLSLAAVVSSALSPACAQTSGAADQNQDAAAKNSGLKPAPSLTALRIVTPTPVPTPTPPPPFPLKNSTTFQSITGISVYQGSLQNGILGGGNAFVKSVGVAGLSSFVTIGYDTTKGVYTLQYNVSPARFKVSFNSSNKLLTSGYSFAYSKTAGTATDTLALFGNAAAGGPSASAPVALTYTSYGLWGHSDSATGLTTNSYFIFGQPTIASNMPKTGTASYQTSVAAYMLQTGAVPSTSIPLAGTATFTANFGAASVSSVLTLQTAFGSSPVGTFNATSPITGNSFGGALTSNTKLFWGGGFSGAFYGPSAKEMGYTFWIHKYNPDPYAGASPSPQDSTISGVVVGVKK